MRNLNDYEIMGRKLRVDFSNEQKSSDDDKDQVLFAPLPTWVLKAYLTLLIGFYISQRSLERRLHRHVQLSVEHSPTSTHR